MIGGGEYSFLDLLSHLQDPWNVLAVVPGEGELANRLKKNGIDIEVISLPSIRPWYLLSILSSLKIYFNLCRKYRPVLIYANGSRAAFYGGLAGRMLHIPIIWHCRIATPDIMFDPILSRLSTGIIANSQATAKRFKYKTRRKVSVVYNAVDLEWLRTDSVQTPELIESSWKVILIVARTSREKRHDLALSAFEIVAEVDPNAHLVCLGPRDNHDLTWWDFLQERTSQSPYSDKIHWVGQIEDVRPWYRSASLLLLSSENESFGRVLVEAMACGVPIVAIRSGGVPEIVRNGQDGLLVKPGDIDEMANAMFRILKDHPFRVQLANSAKKRAGYFNLDIHVKEMVQIFDGLIKH